MGGARLYATVTAPDDPSDVLEAEAELRAEESTRIDRVLSGDEAAFRTLYGTHTPRLYRLALRMTAGSDADAAEVVQEMWRRAVAGLARFERRSSLGTWLSAITVRCALEHARARARAHGPREGQVAPVPTPLAPRDTPSYRIDLQRAFERLPEGFRHVLVLHDVEGLRHADIAALLGVSVGTSKSQLSRARARMRELLGDDYARR